MADVARAQDGVVAGAATAAGIMAWVASGGTQRPDGSYAGWCDLSTSELSPPYPEITGYVLTFLAGAPGAGDDAARAAAGWLSTRVLGGDLSARPERTGPTVHAFDVAMAGHGLLRYGAVHGSAPAVEAGLRCADHLVHQVEAHGHLPALDPATVASAVTPTWSTAGTAHLLKCVQALVAAHDAGHPQALACAEGLVRAETGAWPVELPPYTCPDDDVRSMHALSYAAEGLWVWGAYASDERALGLSRQLTAWLWERRSETGVPAFVTGDGAAVPGWRQSDVTAQVLRLAQIHRDPGIDVSAELTRLEAEAWTRGPHRGVLYRPDAPERHASCWASMFAQQALRLAGTDDDLAWHELV